MTDLAKLPMIERIDLINEGKYEIQCNTFALNKPFYNYSFFAFTASITLDDTGFDFNTFKIIRGYCRLSFIDIWFNIDYLDKLHSGKFKRLALVQILKQF